MGWDLAAAGTVCFDDITTPRGHRKNLQGGSAVYFALAASRYARAHIVGAAGRDGLDSVRRTVEGCDVTVEGIEVSDGPTMHWYARHDFGTWVTAEERTEQGPYAAWSPRFPDVARDAPVLFVGSMLPELQIQALRQSRARLIGSDSMTLYIADRGEEVRAVVEESDILFLNRSELSALTGMPPEDWVASARALCGRGRLRAVVVKGGPSGAAVVSAHSLVERAAHPVEDVVDPTGAGDSLAGGFLGACARAQRDDDDFFGTALDEGLRCAADAIVAFGTEALRRRTSTAHLIPD